MILSKAIPIRFWQSGNTYNQGIDSVAGVMEQIWNQKWNSTDEVVLQFYDTTEKDYKLRCFDEDEVEIGTLTFTREELNSLWFYSLSFSFAVDFTVTNEAVHLKIVDVFTNIVGALTDTIETASGNILFVDASLNNNITAILTDTIETADGDVVYAEAALFGYALPAGVEADSCYLPTTPLYWPGGTTFAPGITVYSDPALSSAFIGKSYISKAGVIYSINSGTGVVGAATGNIC